MSDPGKIDDSAPDVAGNAEDITQYDKPKLLEIVQFHQREHRLTLLEKCNFSIMCTCKLNVSYQLFAQARKENHRADQASHRSAGSPGTHFEKQRNARDRKEPGNS